MGLLKPEEEKGKGVEYLFAYFSFIYGAMACHMNTTRYSYETQDDFIILPPNIKSKGRRILKISKVRLFVCQSKAYINSPMYSYSDCTLRESRGPFGPFFLPITNTWFPSSETRHNLKPFGNG